VQEYGSIIGQALQENLKAYNKEKLEYKKNILMPFLKQMVVRK